MKLCQDCKYYDDGCIGGDYVGGEGCCRPVKSIAFGKLHAPKNCEKERKTSRLCGKSGRYFVPKQGETTHLKLVVREVLIVILMFLVSISVLVIPILFT